MPPNRSESWRNSANQEGKILLALQAIEKRQVKTLYAAARLYNIPYTTLHARASGRLSRVDKRWHSYKLTTLEEDSLTEWIISMDSRGAAPRPSTIREMADILLATRGESPSPTVGVN